MEPLTQWRKYCLLLCVGLILIVLALLPFTGSIIDIKASFPINLLYIASAVFMLAFWRDCAELKHLSLPLGFFAIVCACGVLSAYHSAHSYETLQNVRRLVFDGLFMVVAYLALRRLDSRGFSIFFLWLLVVVFIQPLATIVDFLIDVAHNTISINTRATGFGNDQPLVYSFILLFAASLSIAMLWLTRVRMIAVGLFLIALLAILANNSRLVFVALFLAILLPFLLFKFAYKKRVLLAVAGLAIAFIASIYIASAQWNDRYNFHKMLNNLSYVLSFQPAQMGRFDRACAPEVFFYNAVFDFRQAGAFHAYNHNSLLITQVPSIATLIESFSILESSADVTIKGVYARIARHKDWLLCSRFSFPQDANVEWEHSSLARLSMNKSVLQAIWQNPLRPNGFGFLNYVDNVEQIFPRDSIHHSYILSLIDRLQGYPHPHNQLLSLIFELSIIGFLAIGGFCYVVFFRDIRMLIAKAQGSGIDSYKDQIANASYGVVFAAGVVFIVALSAAMVFDCLLWRWNTTYLFLLFGIVLASKDALLQQNPLQSNRH